MAHVAGASLPSVVARARTEAPAIRLASVTRAFDRALGLRNVDLQVDHGDVVLVRGPNGCGKTTLLRIIATAITPTYGDGEVFGFDLVSDREAIRARTELLGHRSRLYQDLTGRENLRFTCAMHGVSRSRIPDVLERVGLAIPADGRVRAYSQGMRQRLALARVIIRRPPLVLLDEPYAGLDVEGKDLVDEVILEASTEGRTIVLATHDRSRRTAAAREIVMDSGRIVAGAVP